MLANQDLEIKFVSITTDKRVFGERTDSLLPGNLTVINCSWLYCSNAGSSSAIMPGDELVNDLISAGGNEELVSFSRLNSRFERTGYNICKLLGLVSMLDSYVKLASGYTYFSRRGSLYKR